MARTLTRKPGLIDHILRTCLVLAFVLLCLPEAAQAVITQPGGWAEIYNGTANTTGSVSYNVPAGSGRILVVTVATTSASNVSYTTTGSYNGASLTRIGGASDDTSSQRQHTAILYILEASLPASGPYSLSVTTGGTLQHMSVFAATFAGVDQTSPIDTTQKRAVSSDNSSASFSPALTINANAQGVFIGNIYNRNNTTTITGITDPPSGWSASSRLVRSGTSTRPYWIGTYSYGSLPSSTTTSTATESGLSPSNLWYSYAGIGLKMGALPPHIALTKSADITSAKPGTVITFTAYYHNTGGAAAYSLVLLDTVPPYMTYVPGSLRMGSAASTYTTATLKTDAADGDEAEVGGSGPTFRPATVAVNGDGKVYLQMKINP